MLKNKPLSWIIIVLAIALTLRIFLFLGILIRNPDYFQNYNRDNYRLIAENIVNYGSYSSSNTQPLGPDDLRVPLYPLFLSLLMRIGLSAASIVFVQILISSCTCLLTILLTYKLIGNWQPACLAGGIVAVDIPSIVFSNCLLTEALFSFVFTLSILYLVLYFKRHRVWALLGSGVLMGLSILCRPIVTFLPLFISIPIFLLSKLPKSYIFRNILLYLAVSFLIVSPWLIRNQIVFGSPFLITSMGYHALFNRAVSFYALNEGVSLDESEKLLEEKARAAFRGNIEDEPIRYKKFKAKMAVSIILDYPYTYLRGSLRSILHTLLRPTRSPIDLQLGFSEKPIKLTTWFEGYRLSIFSKMFQVTSSFTIILVFIQLFMLIILWLSFIYGILLSFAKREYLLFWIVVSVIAYFCIISGALLRDGSARFRIPIVPFLAVGSGIGIYDLRRKTK